MRRLIVTIGCGVSLLVGSAEAGSPQAPAPSHAARTITIVFRKNMAVGVGAECFADVKPSKDKKTQVWRRQTVQWNLQKGTCDGFDSQKVTLAFDTKVMKHGPNVKGTANGSASDDVTDVDGDAPNNSQHNYTIMYKGRNAGDPELDINPEGMRGTRPSGRGK